MRLAGAWLLVAGPLFQGALELLEEDIDRSGFDASVQALAPPPPPSRWWWLFPPGMFVLRRRRSNDYHRTVLAQLTPQQRAQRSGFLHKATGWFVVASGGALIAVTETWGLAEHHHWPIAVYMVALPIMFALVGSNTVLHIGRRRPTDWAKRKVADRPATTPQLSNLTFDAPADTEHRDFDDTEHGI